VWEQHGTPGKIFLDDVSAEFRPVYDQEHQILAPAKVAIGHLHELVEMGTMDKSLCIKVFWSIFANALRLLPCLERG
jgi:hypothetical protein